LGRRSIERVFVKLNIETSSLLTAFDGLDAGGGLHLSQIVFKDDSILRKVAPIYYFFRTFAAVFAKSRTN
jgi:hypothetical protein